MADNEIIETTVERWHDFLRGNLEGGLDSLLHDECVFLSPIVFTPQRGREITKTYLTAAGSTLAGSGVATSGSKGSERRFRYVKQVLAGHHAVLEFETWIGDTLVNGVDIITCDDAGMITEFKVMIRPLQAVNAVHEQMRKALEAAGQL
jgi:hypothetical protein